MELHRSWRCAWGPNVYIRCHRSWVRREKVCTPSSQPQPPSSSRQGRCLGEAGCSMQNLHKPGNGWENLHELQIFTRTKAQFERKDTRGNHKRKCGGGNVFTAANAKQVNPFTTTVLKVYNTETRYQPSPGVWSVTHHPSTPHQTRTHFPNPPHLQDKQRRKKKKQRSIF